MRKAFTMIELLIALVMISLIAAFAIPSFNKAVFRAKFKDTLNNLQMIHTATTLYRARFGQDLPDEASLNAINTDLQLNLVDRYATYSCKQSAGIPTTCTALMGTNKIILSLSPLKPFNWKSGFTCATDPTGDGNPCCEQPNFCP